MKGSLIESTLERGWQVRPYWSSLIFIIFFISDKKSKEDKRESINNAYKELSLMIWGVTWRKKIEVRNETGTAICNGIFSSDNCFSNKTNEMNQDCIENRALALEVSVSI